MTKVAKVGGIILWVTDETYYRMVTAHQGYEPKKIPLAEHQKQYILKNHGKVSITEMAMLLDVSRMTIHRFIKAVK